MPRPRRTNIAHVVWRHTHRRLIEGKARERTDLARPLSHWDEQVTHHDVIADITAW